MNRLLAAIAACSVLLHTPVLAQSIAAARNAAIGSQVTVSGMVTSGSSLGGIRYLQDADAGIAAFPGTGSVPGFNPQPGTNITVTGTLTNYSGLLEITPITAFTVNSTGNPLPAPIPITPAGLDESVESRLVRINGVHFTGTGSFAAGTWPVVAGTETANVYFRTGHPMIGTPVPAGAVDITGIGSQFSNNPPYADGYQLLPRTSADITPHASISIQPPVVQSNLATDGFTLGWQTNLPGSTEVFYGSTPALGAHAAVAGNGTAHSLPIAGLQPATFYFAQVFSVSGTDTAFAVPALYSTASTSGGAIKVYFTKSVDTGVSSGQDAIGLFQATDDTIKAYIDRAQSTLDIAMYNTNSTFVVQAVNAAKARGVQVRWIAEGSNANTALNSLNPAIPRLMRTNSEGSGMHNKFMVIDAEDAQRATVMGGSCNWTTQSFFDDYNNIVFIQDQALARCYRLEFEEMWGGSGPQPVLALSRFGAAKTDNTPHLFNVGGNLVESFFSPSDGTTAKIKATIDAAQQNLRLALYIFTENSLSQAVLAAKNRPGMYVAGDVEEVDATGSKFSYLVGQGVQLYSHNTEPGLLHHKYAIVDEGTAYDPRVETGSHNWTSSAETVNDENTLIIHNATVANLFYQEWNARHQAVMAVEEPAGPGILGAWPVPADQWLHVRTTPGTAAQVALLDLAGREVCRTSSTGTADLPVGSLPSGMYVVTCVQGGERTQRLVGVVH